MSDKAAIAEAIILYRRRANLKQKELAEKAGVSPAHLSRIENRKVVVKSSTLKKIAEALEVGLPGLLTTAEELRRNRERKALLEIQYPPPAKGTKGHDQVREEMERMDYFLGIEDLLDD